MNFGPVTKIYERNKTILKEFDDNVILKNYDVIMFFSIYGQSEAIRKLDSGRIICRTLIFINSNLLSYKNGKKN